MTHRVYFSQHGLAIDKTENSQRPLSQAGIEQTRSVAKQLLISGIPVSRIFHSGKLRATQTAEIFASNLNITQVSAHEHLSPNDDVSLFADTLKNHALYVGHLPHLEKLVGYLISGDENLNIIKFQNSAVICLTKNNNNYHIDWHLTPALLTNKRT